VILEQFRRRAADLNGRVASKNVGKPTSRVREVKLLASLKILISIEMMELHRCSLGGERAVKCGSWLF